MVSRTGTGLTHRSYFISIQDIHILLEAYFPVIKTLSERSRTHSVMASANPGLGASAILPPEVRRLIWEHFHPKVTIFPLPHGHKRRTSRSSMQAANSTRKFRRISSPTSGWNSKFHRCMNATRGSMSISARAKAAGS